MRTDPLRKSNGSLGGGGFDLSPWLKRAGILCRLRRAVMNFNFGVFLADCGNRKLQTSKGKALGHRIDTNLTQSAVSCR